ncbi:hypothetical protein BPOR_0678g00060 [Botrytis porri]|uniref:Glucose-methanol-choline oxidoreductase C-terminal domain-containing protein n=1 Tax=Botrytis porri TaxID=87229 RepID=A0A4Z1KAU2_9HELO|nr:hypothetical protein BPOR_0678g00060 [Botrytis porri]
MVVRSHQSQIPARAMPPVTYPHATHQILTYRDHLKLNSTNPLEQPLINLNFLSIDLDLVALREGCQYVDDILMNGDGMKDIIGEDYPWPMPRNSEEVMHKMILERSPTGFHKLGLLSRSFHQTKTNTNNLPSRSCGTVRLGKPIDQGVVDHELRSFGVKNIRITDVAVFSCHPRLPNSKCNLHDRERGAGFIKAAHSDLYQ